MFDRNIQVLEVSSRTLRVYSDGSLIVECQSDLSQIIGFLAKLDKRGAFWRVESSTAGYTIYATTPPDERLIARVFRDSL